MERPAPASSEGSIAPGMPERQRKRPANGGCASLAGIALGPTSIRANTIGLRPSNAADSAYAVYATTSVRVKTYRDVVQQYQQHAGSEESCARRDTVSHRNSWPACARRPVAVSWVVQVGKESNRLEEVEAGLIHDPEEIYTEYSAYTAYPHD